MKIVIAGGSGFIGKAVVDLFLAQGHELVLLSRRSSAGSRATTVLWDAVSLGAWCAALEGADALIDLCGENISAGRWTAARKALLRTSRLGATALLVKAIAACGQRPKVFINASAVGYYGDGGDAQLDESSPSGKDFLAGLCVDWEKAAFEAERYGVRVVTARFGMVLGPGGALEKLVVPFKFYAGGPLGSGRQWVSWISRRDLAGALSFISTHEAIKGPVNIVAPSPLGMSEFCAALGKVLHRPSWARVPVFVLRFILGEMADVILSSQRVVPKKLMGAGFSFEMPLIKDAIADALRV